MKGHFDGGSMTSDAGVTLLGATDRKPGSINAAMRCFADQGNAMLINHGTPGTLRQRAYMA